MQQSAQVGRAGCLPPKWRSNSSERGVFRLPLRACFFLYGTFFSNLYFCQAPNELVPFLPQKGQACTAPAWPLLHYFSNQTPKTSKWPAGRYFSFRRSPFLSIYLCSSVDGSQSSIYLSSRVLKAAHKGEKLLGPSRGVFSCSLRPVKVMTLLARRRS